MPSSGSDFALICDDMLSCRLDGICWLDNRFRRRHSVFLMRAQPSVLPSTLSPTYDDDSAVKMTVTLANARYIDRGTDRLMQLLSWAGLCRTDAFTCEQHVTRGAASS